MAKGSMGKIRDLLEQALAECDGAGMDDEEEDSMMGKSMMSGKKGSAKKGKKDAMSIAMALSPKKGKK